jgi:hypothetical protein
MPRRTTDLFEVFQARPQDGASKGRGRKRPSRKKSARTSKRGGGFHGIFLNPRQVLLSSCVLVLLLVLSFTVGLGIGRGGGGGATPALSSTNAPAGAWYIRGKMHRLNIATGQPVDPDRVHEDLVRKYRFRAQDVRVAEGGANYYEVFYGPFRSEAQARGVMGRRKLHALRVQGDYPFGFAEIVREDRPAPR